MTQTANDRHLAIDDQLCQMCARCLVMRSCRGMAVLRFDRDEPPVIDVSRCMNCQVCMGMCPFGAVIWRW
ncbi:MAG: 4Fe-4S binding protein [Anaerolineae bacterium]|nr:4Fe-4S binding protein [Anaerolineae bacterium]MCB9141301.1 4Fe-4S binding protein [Anaerolineales bacterium]MCB0228417.1 4Fe-4S binding protein [Anaerolineae bacterium]MCB0232921.1 4Fe-4S binding protein [Anaerolineae bacterium]MCB0238927.1 4Fe-4S binding protein [Anaerolineae bacterium]